MADIETESERTRRRLQDLEGRVHTLESIAIRALAFTSGTMLVAGSTLPIFTDERSFDPVTVRLLTAPLDAFASLSEEEVLKGFGVAAGIGFLVLLACVATAVVICCFQWQRWAGPRVARTAAVVAVLLLVGMLVPVYFTIGAAQPELDDSAGPAMWYFVPGVIIFAATALNGHLRQLWSREE
jgi:hypothetical protein